MIEMEDREIRAALDLHEEINVPAVVMILEVWRSIPEGRSSVSRFYPRWAAICCLLAAWRI
jgi:hypothetical protein